MKYADIATKEDREFIAVCRRFIFNMLDLNGELSRVFAEAYASANPTKAENAGRAAVNSMILSEARAGGMEGSWRDYVPAYNKPAARQFPVTPTSVTAKPMEGFKGSGKGVPEHQRRKGILLDMMDGKGSDPFACC